MCCTPYVATIVAGVLTIFQSFANLCWNVPIIISFSFNKTQLSTLATINTSELENPFAILNVQLLVFSCLMLKANSTMKTSWIGAWCILINVKSLVNVLLGIYFFYVYGDNLLANPTYFHLAVVFSGVFFFWPTINTVLFIMVSKRYTDIVKFQTTNGRVEVSTREDAGLPPPYTTGIFARSQSGHAVNNMVVTDSREQLLLHFEDDDRQPTAIPR
ncbi:uncharacterized protein LOC118189171 isoform X2 [Stegodyphus dumicola]|uniref:uncharacterized protein LOC118189171 isoform X2 n=1 Tax=Stegodyphus dumicola TaxID=202533 RepID=UPI0015AEC75D|nr:uncharacterized protein LOC118189171 isoform X2 [Stegodyphus dumicola]